MKSAGLLLVLLATALASAQTEPESTASKKVPAHQLGFTYKLIPTAPAANASTSLEPVIVLPDFDVRERPIDLEPHRLLTPKGRLIEAKRLELSPLYQKTFGPLAFAAALYFNPMLILTGSRANDAEATILYEQDERLRRLREAEDLIDLCRDDPAMRRELTESMRQSFGRELPPPRRR